MTPPKKIPRYNEDLTQQEMLDEIYYSVSPYVSNRVARWYAYSFAYSFEGVTRKIYRRLVEAKDVMTNKDYIDFVKSEILEGFDNLLLSEQENL